TGNDPINRIDPNGLDDIPTQPGETIYIEGEAPGMAAQAWFHASNAVSSAGSWAWGGFQTALYLATKPTTYDDPELGPYEVPAWMKWFNIWNNAECPPMACMGTRGRGGGSGIKPLGGSGIRQPKPGVHTPNNGVVTQYASTQGSPTPRGNRRNRVLENDELHYLKDEEPGTVYTGIYDPNTKSIIAMRSRPNDDQEPGTLPRTRGHEILAETAVERGANKSDLVGFSIHVEEEGISIGWNSASVNGKNFGNPLAPSNMRVPIAKAVKRAVGLDVWPQYAPR
ncbi:hypothetical protein, partial [Streptosporangium sp. OZ121]|uniref:hypothetical protein n=1 Tax=Streptosporangium sp. OZ121 TaxID=3444183 RepID=UPI003F7ABB68